MDKSAQSISIKLRQTLALLQLVEIKATEENLKCMLACQNTMEEIEQDILKLGVEANLKEVDSDA